MKLEKRGGHTHTHTHTRHSSIIVLAMAQACRVAEKRKKNPHPWRSQLPGCDMPVMQRCSGMALLTSVRVLLQGKEDQGSGDRFGQFAGLGMGTVWTFWLCVCVCVCVAGPGPEMRP